MQILARLLALACLLLFAAPAGAQAPSYLLFESGHVRPMALSPNGLRLFAVNTPDNRLEIFDVAPTGDLTHSGSVPVGMEPVAVAARSNDEVWVVNHLSDSVSIVDLSGATPRVSRTLHVGDEPNDIVFAGTSFDRAFISSAHRGQNSPNGGRGNRTGGMGFNTLPDASGFDTPGTGRADVWVFDSASLGTELGGTPLTVISLFGDKPRGLAVNANGSSVYAAVFRSGNKTTVLNELMVCDTSPGNINSESVEPSCTLPGNQGETSPGGNPPPHNNVDGDDRPEVSIIVKENRDGLSPGVWQDELDRDWSALVRHSQPDRDVFEIDANASPPVAVDGTATCVDGSGCWAGVGTTLFNLLAHPVSGKIYVTNSDAQNHVRFEGPGTLASGIKPLGEPATVQGNLAQMRITVLDGANVNPRHLNKHIDYSVLPAPAGVADDSLATPLGMALDLGGAGQGDDVLYVTAFGSQKIGIFDVDDLENDTFTPSSADHISLTGGGPSGLLFQNGFLYVMTRFDNSVAVIDTLSANAEIQKLALYNPESQSILDGRPFLYDAQLTSSNGEASCASCHIFGDMDDLGWDLGNPDDVVVANGNPFHSPPGAGGLPLEFHPSKGPMTTQSLRGLDNMGPQHWRGDRQGDENAAFTAFNVAFPGLVGRAAELTPAEMAEFTAFALQIRYPPNPITLLDRTRRPPETNAFGIFLGPRITDGVETCEGCHTLSPLGGLFGGDVHSTFDATTQHFKVPHLRNMYQKVGMFGMPTPDSSVIGGAFEGDPSPYGNKGAQIRGFGFSHDGSIDTTFRFTSAGVFSLTPSEQTDMQALMMAFFTDLAPIIGQQVTLTSTSGTAVTDRIDLLESLADKNFNTEILGGTVKDCQLIAHAVQGSTVRGYLYDPGSETYAPDDGGSALSETALRSLANTAGQEVTYTCAPAGSGSRMALDRDEDLLLNGHETGTGFFVSATDTGSDPAKKDTDGDGFLDGDEVLNLGSDPNDPNDPNTKVPSLSPFALLALSALVGAVGGLAARRRRG